MTSISSTPSPTATAPPTPSEAAANKKGSHIATIAVAIVFTIYLLLGIACLAAWVLRRYRRRQDHADEAATRNMAMATSVTPFLDKSAGASAVAVEVTPPSATRTRWDGPEDVGGPDGNRSRSASEAEEAYYSPPQALMPAGTRAGAGYARVEETDLVDRLEEEERGRMPAGWQRTYDRSRSGSRTSTERQYYPERYEPERR